MVWTYNGMIPPGKTSRQAALTPKMIKQRKVYTMGLGAAPFSIMESHPTEVERNYAWDQAIAETNPSCMPPSTPTERIIVQSWREQYEKDPAFMPESTIKEREIAWLWRTQKPK